MKLNDDVTITLVLTRKDNLKVSKTGKTLKLWEVTPESVEKANALLPPEHYVFNGARIAGGVKVESLNADALDMLDMTNVTAPTVKGGVKVGL